MTIYPTVRTKDMIELAKLSDNDEKKKEQKKNKNKVSKQIFIQRLAKPFNPITTKKSRVE